MKKTEYTKLVVADNLPHTKDLDQDTIYHSPAYKIVRFLCPCGCGHEIMLRTAPEVDVQGRKWKVELIDKKITLHNSVFVSWNGGCQSHFFIRKNQVQWAQVL